MIGRKHILSIICCISFILILHILFGEKLFHLIPIMKFKYVGTEWKWKSICFTSIKLIKYSVPELSTSLSSYLYAEQNQEVLDRLMARNVSSLTPSELGQFYSIKEAQYRARRARVQAYCRTQQGGNFSRLVYRHLLYDDEAGRVLGNKFIDILVTSICSGPCLCMPNSKGGWNNLAWALCSSRYCISLWRETHLPLHCSQWQQWDRAGGCQETVAST